MLGFLPGFAYMGLVDEKISSSRKQKPVFVEAGSIGIAGKQTGIYPFRSQGGWQIIGRTPLKLFDKEKINPVLFKPGDKIQFYSITNEEFVHLKNNPLS
jgi:inhibitor of KinA